MTPPALFFLSQHYIGCSVSLVVPYRFLGVFAWVLFVQLNVNEPTYSTSFISDEVFNNRCGAYNTQWPLHHVPSLMPITQVPHLPFTSPPASLSLFSVNSLLGFAMRLFFKFLGNFIFFMFQMVLTNKSQATEVFIEERGIWQNTRTLGSFHPMNTST